MNKNEIIEKYYTKIYKLCLYNLNNEQEAEDLTQDIFFKVFDKIDSFNSQSQLYTWIYRIAINTIINYSKRKRLVKFISFSSDYDPKTEISYKPEDDPAKNIECDELETLKLKAIEDSLKLLSTKERTAFYLFSYDNLKQKVIAEIMNTSISAVESLIFKSKRKIKKEIARLYPDICQR